DGDGLCWRDDDRRGMREGSPETQPIRIWIFEDRDEPTEAAATAWRDDGCQRHGRNMQNLGRVEHGEHVTKIERRIARSECDGTGIDSSEDRSVRLAVVEGGT